MPHRFLIGATTILVGSLLIYYPAIRGGFIWDDDDYVTSNTALRTTEGLGRIWMDSSTTHQYYPLVHSMFWVEYRLWGLEPLGYHLVNVCLHAASAILFWLVLCQLEVPGALLAALVFAFHPVHVESVAWITERKNVLSGFFYLAALLLYARGFLRPDSSAEERNHRSSKSDSKAPDWKLYFYSLALFVCALLSKTVTCSLPAALLLLLWWKRGKVGVRDLVLLLPFFIVGLGMGLSTAWIERHQVGAKGAEWAFSFLDRCLIAGRALWFYAAKLVLPYKLTFFYPRWTIDSGAAWQFLFPATVMLAIATLWLLRTRIGRGPLVAVLIFAGTLAPALGFFDVYPMRFSFVADHFQYHASLAGIALLSACIAGFLDKVFVKTKIQKHAVVTIIAVILGLLTWNQAKAYHNVETLYRDTLAKNPGAWMAHQNLGAILLDQGQLQDALAHIGEAVRLKPDEAGARSLLGLALYQSGNLEEAEASYRYALKLDGLQADALNNLAWLRAVQFGTKFYDPDAAIDLAKQACSLGGSKKPDYFDTLATAYAAAGKFKDALETEGRAIDLAQLLGQQELARSYQTRLELFRSGAPFREALPSKK